MNLGLSITDDRLKDATGAMLLLLVWDAESVKKAGRDMPLPVLESAEFTPQGIQYRQNMSDWEIVVY